MQENLYGSPDNGVDYKEISPRTNYGDVEESREEESEIKSPEKDGWYWVLLEGYDTPIPCLYTSEYKYFLPGGLGDSSSMGIYLEDIEKIGPEIIVPNF
jgi:hypothetical protein